jgi:hypothetical protein
MVIFIDDLDRCSPAKIAQVLEAINLFLAGEFPDCFFVIGMDTEMVAAALQTAHKDMIANLPADSRIPVGWRFMDKFVQLPFIIPPSGVEAERDFVARLFVGSDGGSRTDAAAGPQAADTTPANASRGADREARAVRSKEIIGRGIEAFREDNPDIRKHVDGAARFFQGNPRDMKRFVNAFRFHYLLWWARRSQELPVPPLDALVGWTILAMKWPEHVRWLRRIESKRLAGDALVRAFGSAAPNDPSGNTNHLAVVEHASHKAADDLEAWASTMRQLYEIRPESGWLADRSLLAFYAARADEPLSAFAGKGFW